METTALMRTPKTPRERCATVSGPIKRALRSANPRQTAYGRWALGRPVRVGRPRLAVAQGHDVLRLLFEASEHIGLTGARADEVIE